ncbi:MAG: GNAT family N-acetyltransferase, partial [Bradyrhizobium sp. 35-63-5]
MATAHPKLALRPFLPPDTPILADIFRESVTDLTSDDYSEAQQAAWVSAIEDLEAFAKRLGGQLSLIGTLQGSPVGFASLA